MSTYRLTVSAVFVAIGTLTANLFYIPVGVSKCFPMQNMIDALTGALLGPVNATIIAFVISLLRNLLGTGSPLAFPGSMIGACLAGILYKRFLCFFHKKSPCRNRQGGSFSYLFANTVMSRFLLRRYQLKMPKASSVQAQESFGISRWIANRNTRIANLLPSRLYCRPRSFTGSCLSARGLYRR